MHPQDPDHVPPELEALITFAAHAPNRHTNDADLCAVCGCARPCNWAVLAEHNLATL